MAHSHPGSSPGLWLVWLLITGAVLMYALAASRRGGWSVWRSASFIGGGALLVVGFSTPVMAWAHADLRGHMAQHLLLGMFAPLLLVLGAPVTLLLGGLPAQAARRLVRVLDSPPARFLTHPVTAMALNIGGMVALYATPLYALSRELPWLHVLVHYHFVAAGCLFAWSIAGPDPAPRRPSLGLRGIVLFAALAIHGVLGKLMYAHGWPQGTPASLEEIRSAAQWMYYGGDLAEMLLLAALLSIWFRRETRLAKGRPASQLTAKQCPR